MVEVDITSPSLEQLPLYSRFGVREAWRADADGGLTIHRFDAQGDPTNETESEVLSGLTAAQVAVFLRGNKTLGRRAWIDAVRDWAHKHPPQK